MLAKLLKNVLGSSNDRQLRPIRKLVNEINALEDNFKSLSDGDLYNQTDRFRDRLVKGETIDQLLPEAFAVVRETSSRVLGLRHFDVQMIGGIALHRCMIAEMKTGEGKTLVATLAAYLNALSGEGVHVITVNDYLAHRDAQWMAPLYQALGMSVGVIQSYQGPNTPNSFYIDAKQQGKLVPSERKQSYAADITYGTNNEFGFDYLRDNMALRLEDKSQRGLGFAIVDEVDSVLVDEARTPLIISGPTPKGDEHEFDELKPKVVSIVKVQQKAAQGFLSDAKKYLVDGASKQDVEKGGLALFRAFRALPKSKPLIKFLSQDGMRQQLLKTEGYYLADNQREMHKADEELFFVIDEKQNQIELTEKGIEYLVGNMSDEHFFTMPDLATELVGIDKGEGSDDQKLEKKQQLM